MLDSHLIAETRPEVSNDNVLFSGNKRISVLFDRLIRIEENAEKIYCDDATQTVWFRDMQKVAFSSHKEDGVLVIDTGKVVFRINDDLKKSTAVIDGKRVSLFGRSLPGTYSTLDVCNGDISHPESDEKAKIKLGDSVISRSGAAVLDDGSSLILGKDGRMYPRKIKETDIYVFAFGNDYRGAVYALYAISGKVPLIPRFALGNWWSRYHDYDEKEYIHLVDRLARENIPITVATVDMDWHWSKTLEEKKHVRELGKYGDHYGGYTGWTGYSWNTDLFPDYKRFLKKLKDRNLKITLNLHPGSGVRWFEDQYPEMAKAVGADPSSEKLIPFDLTSDTFVNAYFKVLHKPYERDGVDFWWIDWQQGNKSNLEGLNPLWLLNHYHTLDIALESPTPMILSRYSGIGSHRYPLGFSGDTYITWKSLDYIPFFTASASNVGYTWWSHDIGGHMHGIKSDELYTRYVQFGVFSPINRLHCTSTEVCTKEPDVYMNGSGEIAKRFLRFRHKMIPYLYSASIDTSENGRALIEPLYYRYPHEESAYMFKNEYFFGSELLVAPVTKKGDREKLAVTKIWLPEGKWTDIFTGDEYEGGKTVETVRWLDSMPVLAKAGGFLVLDGREGTNLCDEPDSLRVLAFNGDGSYVLREDGGETEFTSVGTETTQTVTVISHASVKKREIALEFRNITGGSVTVTEDGKEIPFECDDDGCLSVVLPCVAAGKTYTVKAEFKTEKNEKRNAAFFYTLQRIERANNSNSWLFRNLCPLTDEECRALIAEQKLTVNQRKRLLECME